MTEHDRPKWPEYSEAQTEVGANAQLSLTAYKKLLPMLDAAFDAHMAKLNDDPSTAPLYQVRLSPEGVPYVFLGPRRAAPWQDYSTPHPVRPRPTALDSSDVKGWRIVWEGFTEPAQEPAIDRPEDDAKGTKRVSPEGDVYRYSAVDAEGEPWYRLSDGKGWPWRSHDQVRAWPYAEGGTK